VHKSSEESNWKLLVQTLNQ